MIFEVPSKFGYVILTGTASVFVLIYKGINVGMARKKYEVKYPIMYSDENGGDNMFNCVQRAHQNTLENYPQFLFFLTTAGLSHPVLASLAGVIYLAGRIAFAKGYYTGNPENRRWGSFGYIGLLTMLGCSIHTSLKFLGIAWVFLSKYGRENLKTTTFKQHSHQPQVFGHCLNFLTTFHRNHN